MKRLRLLFSVLAAFVLCSSCQKKGVETNPLLDYIPSDASVLICGERMDVMLETAFEPDHRLRDLMLSRMASEPAVVSFHYSGQLVPLLATAYGRPSETPPSPLARLSESAEALGMSSLYIPAAPHSGMKNVLLISESESVLDAAVRHIDEQASILEVSGVREVLSNMPSGGQTLLLRNDAAASFLPKSLMERYLRRRNLISFVNGFCSWTVMHLEQVRVAGKGQYMDFSIIPVRSGAADEFCAVLDRLKPAPSHLGSCLPYGTTFALDMPLASFSETLESRKLWLDATGGLNRFNTACRSRRTPEGWDPVRWGEEIGLQELARLWCRSEELLLLRCSSAPAIEGVVPCPWAGFCSILFGNAFSLADERWCALSSGWIVIGSERAVRHYLQKASGIARKDWNVKSTKAAVFADDLLLSCEEDGIRMEVYKTY